jgi:hypothetical protein
MFTYGRSGDADNLSWSHSLIIRKGEQGIARYLKINLYQAPMGGHSLYRLIDMHV